MHGRTVLSIASVFVLSAVVSIVSGLPSQYGGTWDYGPKGTPRLIVTLDEIDPADTSVPAEFLRAVIESGYQDDVWLVLPAAFLMALCGLGYSFIPERKPSERPKSRPKGFDEPLMMWNSVDFLSRRGLLDGGVLTLGRPGSGKTNSSGMALGRAIAGDPQGTVLIIAAKPEDAAMWKGVFAEFGRELLVVEPGGYCRCNLLGFIQKVGGSTREIGEFLFTATECLRGEASGGGEYGTFFLDEERRAVHHAIEVLRQGGEEISIPNLQKFISGAALSVEQRKTETWLEGCHNGVLRKAAERQKTPAEQHDYEMANQFWAVEWVTMAEKTRSCVLAGILNNLFHFNTGFVRELVSTDTTVTPLDLLKGRPILINCPSCEYGDAGKRVSTAWKHIVQKTILARSFKPGDFYNVIWADEAYQVVTSFDQHYAAQSRSHGGAMVYLAQSRDSFYSALKGENGKAYADTLIGQFATKVIHALGSAEDAQYAASLLGVRLETTYGGSSTPPEDYFDSVFGGFFGKNNVTTSYNESYQPVIQPRVFMNGLRTGGHANRGLVDAIVVRSGEPFSSGENFLFATFKQG